MASILYVDGLDPHEKDKNAMVITPNPQSPIPNPHCYIIIAFIKLKINYL